MRTVLKHWLLSGGGASEHPGTTLYKAQPLYLNFNKLSEEDEEEIESNPTNLGTMELTIEPVNAPILSQRLSGKSFIDYGLSAFNLNNDGTGLFDRSFFIDVLFSGDNGSSGFQVLGAKIENGREIAFFIGSDGKPTVNWGYGGTRFIRKTTSAILPASTPYGSIAVSIECDFENDTAAFYTNGILEPSSFTSGNISTFTDPTGSWDNTYDVHIAAINQADTLVVDNPTNTYFHKIAVGGTRTAEERALMLESLTTDWS